jgi:phosphatidate cytidylyltransferase
MSNLAKRALTGIALVSIIAASISWGYYTFVLLILTINMFSLLEFYRLFYSEDILPAKSAGGILSLSIMISFSLVISGNSDWKMLLINIPVAFGIFIAELYRKAKHPFHNLAFTFLGIFYITIPLCFFIAIAFLPVSTGIYHCQVILGYFFILWANDTFAYITGQALGRHPLFKRISPGKTWEGSIGGAACALLTGYAISHYFTLLKTVEWINLAIIIIVIGTFGDLIKSLMKRSLDLKDSGTILPGHGGMLDRFDSLLSSAPFVFAYLILLNYE